MPSSPSSAVLREILESERTCCLSLAVAVERERECASTHDLAGLLASNKEREAIQARWTRIVQKRRDWLRRCDLTLEALEEDDPDLALVHGRLRELSRELHRAQGVNRGLISAVLGQVSGLIDSFQQELPSSRYDGGAGITSAVPTSRGFARSA
jgi:hypothetical protein